MIYTRILGTGSYLPNKILSNKDLEKMIDTNDQWIMERTGIRNRHLQEENENTTTMAETAARRAIEAAKIDPKKIDLIIVATVTPEKLFPNTASKIQNLLGISSTQCPAFDLSAACSGFIYGLSIVDQYIKSGSKKCVLLIGVESLTRFVDWTDRSTCILFSDGAGAAILGPSEEPGVYSNHTHADGSYGEDILYLSGSTYNKKEPCYIRMRGNEVFKVAVTKLGQIVDETLAFNKLEKGKIDWLIPHQANLRIIQAMAKKLRVPMERVILTIEDQGNTSAASVPIALDTGIRDGRIKRGDLMLLEAFGAGFLWGASLIRY
jgi:3-oxoacyl-[acyl-carrier-protein] synthase III